MPSDKRAQLMNSSALDPKQQKLCFTTKVGLAPVPKQGCTPTGTSHASCCFARAASPAKDVTPMAMNNIDAVMEAVDEPTIEDVIRTCIEGTLKGWPPAPTVASNRDWCVLGQGQGLTRIRTGTGVD